METPLIEAREVRKSYWIGKIETPVLNGIRLKIPERACLSVTGASGTGKSTLLHLLASLDPPTGGKVLFRGLDLYAERDRSLSRLRNEQIGFVFQFHHLMPEFTALENVMMPLLIRGVPRAEARERADAVLAELGLQARSGHRPAELSGGEQQRVAVGRAIVGTPAILFADEPTGNLDRANGGKLVEILLGLHARRGMSLVLVTHNEEIAGKFPVRFHLAEGRLREL